MIFDWVGKRADRIGYTRARTSIFKKKIRHSSFPVSNALLFKSFDSDRYVYFSVTLCHTHHPTLFDSVCEKRETFSEKDGLLWMYIPFVFVKSLPFAMKTIGVFYEKDRDFWKKTREKLWRCKGKSLGDERFCISCKHLMEDRYAPRKVRFPVYDRKTKEDSVTRA